MAVVIAFISVIGSMFLVSKYALYFGFSDLIISLVLAFTLSYILSCLTKKITHKKLLAISKITSCLLSTILLLELFFLLYKYNVFYDFVREDWHSNVKRIDFLFGYKTIGIATIITFASLWYQSKYKTISKFNKYSIFIFTILTLIFFSSFLILNEYSPYLYNALNVSPVLMPIINVYYDVFPPIDALSQYGLYAYYIVPFLKIFGISITSVTFIFALCFFFTFYLIFIYSYKITNNLLMSVAATGLALFLATTLNNTWPAELYYQFSPIRTIIPSLSLIPVYYMINNKDSLPYIFLLIFVFTILIFWNLDSGIPVLLSLISLMTLKNFLNLLNTKKYLYYSVLTGIYILFSLFIFFSTLIIFQILTNKIITVADIFYVLKVWGIQDKFTMMHTGSFIMAGGLYKSFDGIMAEISFDRTLFYFYFTLLLFFSLSLIKLFTSNIDTKKYLNLFYTATLTIGLSTYGLNASSAPRSVFLLPVVGLIYFNTLKFDTLKSSFISIFKNNIQYIFLTFLYILFFIFFVIDLTKNPNFIYTPTFYTILNPSVADSRGLYPIMGGNPNNPDYIKISDLAKDSKIKPYWKVRSDWFEQFLIDGTIKKNDKILVVSEDDYLIHLKLKKGTSIKILNWHHTVLYNRQKTVIEALRTRKIDWILYDPSPLSMDLADDNFTEKFNKTLRENYIMYKESEPMVFDWGRNGFVPTKQSLWRKINSN